MHIFESKALGFPLLPFSGLFAIYAELRNRLYDQRALPIRRVACKVISIGNVSVGGTGKTPAVEFLARYLLEHGKRVAIVSRGYRGRSRRTAVVSNGHRILMDVEKAGDEPYLLAKRLKNVPVIVDKDRGRGVLYAVEHFEISHVLLDDAFQHRRLHRDVDIVLVSATQGFGNGWLLPAGPLRERRRELRRAQLILLTKSDLTRRRRDLEKRKAEIIRYTSSPVLEARHVARRVVSLDESIELRPQELDGKRVVVFSGIADPKSFHATLENLGAKILKAVVYPDHHRYRPKEIAHLKAQFLQWTPDLLMTTAKDAVRLPSSLGNALPIFYLDMVMEVSDPVGVVGRLVL